MNPVIKLVRQARIKKLKLCPLPKLLSPISNGKVLVFAPHSDDETLGCGGTLALLQKNNCEIKVVYITDSGGAGTLADDAKMIRRNEAIAAMAVIGIKDLLFMDEPDGNFCNSSRFEKKIIDIILTTQPDWLFLPSVLDYHRDHVAIGLAISGCWHRCQNIGRAFFYEIWTPLPATCIVNISSVAELKRAAISCYKLPLAHCDYLSASMGLSAYRGLYLARQETLNYAEAFVEIEKTTRCGNMLNKLLNLRIFIEKPLHD